MIGVAIMACLLIGWWLLDAAPIALYGLLLAAMVATLLGLLKIREPGTSLRLCPHYLQYFHPRGQWALPWTDIRRIDVPHMDLTQNYQPLPYVGLKLNNYDTLLNNISLRLASKLLMEQRPVLVQALSQSCPTGSCGMEDLIENDTFKSDSKVYRGLLAMLANRMQTLRKILGYDLYIPANSLDRSCEDFVQLLRQYHQQAQS